jgi:hypothetical protein
VYKSCRIAFRKTSFQTAWKNGKIIEERRHQVKDDVIVDFKEKFWDPSKLEA